MTDSLVIEIWLLSFPSCISYLSASVPLSHTVILYRTTTQSVVQTPVR